MTSVWTRRTWTFPRRMLEDLLGLTLLTWLAYLVVVAGIVVGIATFDSISRSVWEPASELARWFALFIGFYVAYDLLPLYVTHGQTRRDFAAQAAIFTLIFAAALAALMATGHGLEAGLYRLNDWPRELTDDHLFSSAAEFPLIFAEYGLVFLVWTATGLFLGAAIYRFEDAGGLAIAPALIPVTVTDLAFGTGWGPLAFVIRRLIDPGSASVAAAIPIGAGCFLLALAMAWPVVRDIPIRSKST